MAVARCSMVVARHRPCVITLVCDPLLMSIVRGFPLMLFSGFH